jgi:hypothetical protein
MAADRDPDGPCPGEMIVKARRPRKPVTYRLPLPKESGTGIGVRGSDAFHRMDGITPGNYVDDPLFPQKRRPAGWDSTRKQLR